MIIEYCRITTDTDKVNANKLNINPSIYSTLCSLFIQNKKANNEVIPEETSNEFFNGVKNLYEENLHKLEELDLAFPSYQMKEDQSSLIIVPSDNRAITIKKIDDNNLLEVKEQVLRKIDGIKEEDKEELNNLIKNPHLCYCFLLWYSLETKRAGEAITVFSKYNNPDFFSEVLRKMKKYTNSKAYTQRFQNNKNFNDTIEYINNCIHLSKAQEFLNKLTAINKHIKFYADTHTYEIDGKKADLTVTEYAGMKKDSTIENFLEYKKNEGEKKDKGKYFDISTAIGDTFDNLIRTFFSNKNHEVGKNYANFTADDIDAAKEYGKRFETALKNKHGNNIAIITKEDILRVCATVKEDDKEYLMAGGIDMIVVDGSGDIWLYDFKTKRANSGKLYFDDSTKEKYFKQLTLYKNLLTTLFPEMKDKIHVGGLLHANVLYEEPIGKDKDGVESGKINYEYRTLDDGSKQVYVKNSDGSLTPIQNATINNLKHQQRVFSFRYIEDDFQSLTEAPNIVNSVPSSYGVPEGLKQEIKSEDIISDNTPVASGVEPNYKGQATKEQIKNIINRKQTQITKIDKNKYWSNVKEGDIISLHSENVTVLVRVKNKAELSLRDSSQDWKEKNVEKNDTAWNNFKKEVENGGVVYTIDFEFIGIDETETLRVQNKRNQELEEYNKPATSIKDIKPSFNSLNHGSAWVEKFNENKINHSNASIGNNDSERQAYTIASDLNRNKEEITRYKAQITSYVAAVNNASKFGADAVYAIANIGESGWVQDNVIYGTQAGIKKKIPVYVFDQNTNKWRTWDYNTKKFVEYNQTPILSKHAACIQTDKEISAESKKAIQDVIDATKASFENKQQSQSSNLQQQQQVVNNQLKEVTAQIANSSVVDKSLDALNQALAMQERLLKRLEALEAENTKLRNSAQNIQTPTQEENSQQQEQQESVNPVAPDVTSLNKKPETIVTEKPKEDLESAPNADDAFIFDYVDLSSHTRLEEMYKKVTPQQLSYRKNFITSQFLLSVEDEYNQIISDIQDDYDKAVANNDSAMAVACSQRLNILQDDYVKGIHYTIQTKGVKYFSDSIFQIIQRRAKTAKTEDQKEQYQLMLQYFPEMFNAAAPLIEKMCYVNITLDAPYQFSTPAKTEQEAESTEPTDMNDDDAEEVVAGNDGWNFKVKFMNPNTTYSSTTKSILRGCLEIDKTTGKPKKDDLGNPIYLDEMVAHNILLSETCKMRNVDDFYKKTTDENGVESYRFPVLEKASKKYPFIRQVISRLSDTSDKNINQKISAVYHDLRQEFKPYVKILSDGKVVFMNTSPQEEFVLLELTRNFANGVTMHKKSVFNNTSQYMYDNISTGEMLVKKIKALLYINNSSKFKSKEEIENNSNYSINEVFKDLVQLCQMIGLNITTEEIKGICDSYEDFRDALAEMQSIFYDIYHSILSDKVIRNKHHSIQDYNFIVNNASTIRRLGRIVGFVKEGSHMATFRQGQQQYASYTAPSYYDKIIKGLTAKGAARKEFIQKQFKQFAHFFEKGKWKGSTTLRTPGGSFELPCLLEAIESNWHGIRDKFNNIEILFNGETEFSEWSVDQMMENEWIMYSDSDVAMSSSNLGRYNNPIFADSNHALYTTGIKYHDSIYVEEYDDGTVGDYSVLIEEQISHLLAKQAIKEIERIDMVDRMNDAASKGKWFPIKHFNGTRGSEFCFLPFLNEKKEEILEEYRSLPSKDRQEDYIARLIEEHYLSEFNEYFEFAWPRFRNLVNSGKLANFGNNDSSERGDYDIKIQRKSTDLAVIQGLSDKDAEKKKKEMAEEEQKIRDKAELREFYFNRIFMQSQLIEMTTVDLAYYKDMEDFQKRFKELVACGFRPNTSSKYGKKTQKSIYLKDPTVVSNSIKEIDDVLSVSVSQGRMNLDEKERIMKELSSIDPTDGQCFRSFKSYRSTLDMIGLWKEKEEAAYQNIIHNNWSYSDLDVILRVLKSFQFTFTTTEFEGKKIHIPSQYKCSEFPLLACYQLIGGPTKTSKLIALSKFMEDYDIDCAYFSSCVKVGVYGEVDLDNESDEFGHSDKTGEDYYKQLVKICSSSDVIKETDFEDFMIVMPTPPHSVDAETNIGSQMKTIIENMLPDKNPDGSDFMIELKGSNPKQKGIVMTKQQFKKLYDDVYKSKMFDGYKEVVDIFSDIKKVQKYLIRQVKDNPKYGPEMLEALQIVDVQYTDPVTGAVVTKKDFNIPIGYPSIRKQIEDILLSAFKNHVIKLKTKGAANILVADWENKLQVEFEKDKITGEGRLKYVECYMPWYTKKSLANFLVKKTTVVNGKTSEYYEIDYKKIEKEAPGLLDALGYRIPTEASYSILPLRIKGFLPQQYGSAIMLPSDITKVSGSDFDVDKLFILLKHFTINKETGTISEVAYDLSKGVDSLTTEQKDNLYIDLCLSAMKASSVADKWLSGGNFDKLKKTSRTMEILKTPYLFEKYATTHGLSKDEFDEFINTKERGTLPSATILKKVHSVLGQLYNEKLSYVKKFLDENKKPYDPLSPQTYMKLHILNATANKLIGFYAISSMGHYKLKDANMTMYGVPPLIIDGVRLENIDHDSPFGENIAENQAQFIDGSVDAVKDNAIAGLGQNETTAPITNTLVRMGLPIDMIGILLIHPCFDVNTFKHLYRSNPFNVKKPVSLNTAELMADIVLNRDKSQSAQAYLEFMTAVYAINEGLTAATQVNRAETPTGACPTSIPKLIKKLLNCYITTKAFETKQYPIKMKEGFVCAPEQISDYEDVNAVKQSVDDFTLQQAGYSLGMESAISLLGKHIDYLNEDILRVFYDMVNRKGVSLTDKMVELFFNEFNKFLISGSSIMKDDEHKTFYEKREYYTKEFPKFFVEHKDLVKDLAMNFIYWDDKYKELRLSNNADKSKAFHSRLSMEFESFLMSSDPIKQKIVIGLYMYCAYEDKLRFGPNNFGQQFTSRFVSHIPSIINRSRTLRTILHNKDFFTSNTATESMTNFLSQFYTYYWRTFLHRVQKNNEIIFDKNDMNQTIAKVPIKYVLSNVNGEPYDAFCLCSKDFEGNPIYERFVLTRVSSNKDIAHYTKIVSPEVISTKTVYNCNDTIENILQQCPDLTSKSKENKKDKQEDKNLQDGEQIEKEPIEDINSVDASDIEDLKGHTTEQISSDETGSVDDFNVLNQVSSSDVTDGNLFVNEDSDPADIVSDEEKQDALKKGHRNNPNGYGSSNPENLCE